MTKREEGLVELVEWCRVRLGLRYSDVLALVRLERTLHRWAELKCGDGNQWASWSIERDEATELPYLVTYPHKGTSTRRRIPDRETMARKRVEAILTRHPGLVAVYQGDPRGCALTIVRESDIPPGTDVHNWASYGVAVGVA